MPYIMVADDDDSSRRLLQALLEAHQHRVIAVDNGREAFDLAAHDPPDALVTDVLMPDMDGFELCRLWRGNAQLRRVPVVMYTATYTDERDREFALALGVSRFLVKPLEPDRLLGEIQRAIGEGVPDRSPEQTEASDNDLLRRYNQRLVSKLEAKMLQLEESNRRLAQAVAIHEQARTELVRSDARFRMLADHAHDVIYRYRVHPDAEMEYVSPSIERVTGFAPSKFYESPDLVRRILHPEDLPLFDGLIDGRGSEDAAITVRWMHASGSEVWLDKQVRVDDDRVRGVRTLEVIARDITERVERRRETEALQAQLVQAQKMEALGSLAGGVAHDFNNLLMVILSYSQFLREGIGDDPQLVEELDTIVAAADRSAGLVRQLLAFSRRQVVVPCRVDPLETLVRLQKMLARILGEDVVLDIAPSRATPPVFIDPGQLEQVIINLVLNARDAMPAGGRLWLSVDTADVPAAGGGAAESDAGGFVAIEVRDTGEGMTPEVKARAFEPFFTTKEAGRGTGLGLSTVYGIVQQAGGRVEVESAPGAGTRIRVMLPRAPSDMPDFHTPAAVGVGEREGTETVLVVDDEEAICEIVRRSLTQRGYTVLKAVNAGDALLQAERYEGAIDLLLTDIVMPLMNGFALAERVLGMRPQTRVLFMSGFTDHQLLRDASGGRPLPLLGKPFSPAEVAARVRGALDAEPSLVFRPLAEPAR